jgi:hypothetical protein
MSEEQVTAKVRQELEQIRANPKVRDVRAVNGGVVVQTHTLTATDFKAKAEIDLGTFMIWLRLDAANPGVLWLNQSRRVDGAVKKGMNAPYVYSDGHASLELAALVDVAIQFIETIDEENVLNVDLRYWERASWYTTNPERMEETRRFWGRRIR